MGVGQVWSNIELWDTHGIFIDFSTRSTTKDKDKCIRRNIFGAYKAVTTIRIRRRYYLEFTE
jgi:hypothetical protein